MVIPIVETRNVIPFMRYIRSFFCGISALPVARKEKNSRPAEILPATLIIAYILRDTTFSMEV